MKEGTYPAVSYPSSCAFKLVIHTLCQDDAGSAITVASVYIQHNNCPMTLLNLSKYNSASEMFVNLNFPSFVELLRKCVLVLGDSGNLLVNGIAKSSVLYLVRWWSDILNA